MDMFQGNLLQKFTITAVIILFAGAAMVVVHRWKPSTAPSLKVSLISCTNLSAITASNNPSFLVSPVLNRPTRKDAVFTVLNRSDRPVRIEKGIIVEERPTGMHLGLDQNVNRLFQTNIVGFTGTLESGETRTFIVRFWSVGGSFVGGGGQIRYDLRGVCETSPAEFDSRLMKWLKGRPWSKHLPRSLLKEVNSYIFSSAWTQEVGTTSDFNGLDP